MRVIKLTKEYEKKWTDFLNSNDKATFFHSLEWKDIIIDAYRFEPHYYLLLDDNDLVQAIFASFYIKSFMGNKLCSLPYNYYGGPLYNNEESAKIILDHVIKECNKLNIQYLEIKMFYPLEEKIVDSLKLETIDDEYLSFIELSGGLEEVKKRFSRLVRRKLKQLSDNPEFKIRDANDINDVKDFYNIMVKLYKNKFLAITQSFKFIELLWERLVKNNKGFLKVMVFKGKIIGGVLLIDSYDSLLDNWTISDLDYSYISPNYALIFEGIKQACSSNKKILDLGVTGKHNKNLLDFKTRFGSTNVKFVYYYKLIKAKEIKRIDYNLSFLKIRKFVRYIPTPLMKSLSKISIRYFA